MIRMLGCSSLYEVVLAIILLYNIHYTGGQFVLLTLYIVVSKHIALQEGRGRRYNATNNKQLDPLVQVTEGS